MAVWALGFRRQLASLRWREDLKLTQRTAGANHGGRRMEWVESMFRLR
jgi:hypothetical protein